MKPFSDARSLLFTIVSGGADEGITLVNDPGTASAVIIEGTHSFQGSGTSVPAKIASTGKTSTQSVNLQS